MSRGAVAYIDQQALSHNLRRVKQLAPQARVLAMIKSNGYGHGLNQVAQQLLDADAFGVACLEEALQLRQVGIQLPLVVMSGFLDHQELSLFYQHNLSAVVHQPHQVALLEQYNLPIHAWLKVDTGMNRLGFSPQQLPSVYQRLQKVVTSLVLMTHLSSADCSVSRSQQQINDFLQVSQLMAHPKSLVNSAGILNCQQAHADWVRPGILLYGASPLPDSYGEEYGLKSVMTLTAKLIAVKNLQQGESVGYGATWQSPEAMPMGVVAIGYGDGYPRHAVSGTPTLIAGQLCPLIGRVSMDMLCVDLRRVPDAQPGMSVTLWGEGLPVERIAASADTIAYELLCGLTSRVKVENLNDVGEIV